MKAILSLLAGCKRQSLKLSEIRVFRFKGCWPSLGSLYNFVQCNHFSQETTESKLVYRPPLTNQIRMLKTVSLASSIVGLNLQPILIKSMSDQLGACILMSSVVGFFTFVTPVLIHYVTKRYVIDLAFDPSTSTFSATTISFFLKRKKMDFTAEDVIVPTVTGLFTTLLVKGKPLFVDPQFFNNVDYYRKLMGYDKPIDYHLKKT